VSRLLILAAVGTVLARPAIGAAQQLEPAPAAEVHEHVAVTAPLLTPAREASGTSWLPPVTPMYGAHRPWRGWDVRLNGVAFGLAVYESGFRHRTGGTGSGEVGSVNWGMAMAHRGLGGGRFGVRTMFSAEPWTIPGCGTVNFLAVGELCDGDTVHDRQQPHDLFMELAVDYDRGLRGTWRWQVYAGLAGDPALGPPFYLHRGSAVANPIRSMTHHWLDSTHVSFGLVTVGMFNQRWKAEMSVFNGREPDDSQVDLDLGALDSVAGRLSFVPHDRLALQVSGGRLRDATTSLPFQSLDPVTRVIVSALYHAPLASRGMWSTTLAYGRNRANEIVSGGLLEVATAGVLLESSVTLGERHTVFGRGEVGGMPAHHLHAHEYAGSVFSVGKIQVGYVRHLQATKGLVPGLGGTVSVSLLSRELAPRYSGRAAPSFAIFFNLQAARHAM
jgi:hypothetical protein